MKKSRTSLQIGEKQIGRAGGHKNEGRKERLKAFIDEKDAISRRKPLLETDYELSVDKSYSKKRHRGLPNSYIEQIPASTSGTATNKNKEKQIDASTTDRTNLFAGLSVEAQKSN
jgi:hypothetical protein